MMKTSGKLILGAVVVLAAAGGFFAMKSHQSMPGAPAGSVSGPPMGAQGDDAQFTAFKKSHRYTMQLVKLVDDIGHLESDGKAALTPAQAKSALVVLEPLHRQKTLDENGAKEAVKSLRAILTEQQYAVISSLPSESQFRKDGPSAGPMPGGPMPGGPMPAGARPAGDRPAGPPPNMGKMPMKDFNPLNIPNGGPGSKKGSSALDKLIDDLKSKS